ncbi:MAG: hypothetical protein IPI67_16600 [Myxococcales bacterium]|nr:hypothetical protein [Myxococcales bacterium]
MMLLRALAAGVTSAITAFLVVHASGCGTDAVGLEECRDIETARCEAGKFCGLVDDVDQCKRFYRDQCLHGLAAGERPGAPLVKECVATIRAAGACAKAGYTTLAECAADPTLSLPSQKTYHTTSCDIVKEPEGAEECEFLYKPVELPDATPDAELDAGTDASDATVE